MTAREKAKGLVGLFTPDEESIEFNHVKNCALICVDEILEALEHHNWQNLDWITYYRRVKEEIKTLEL